MDEARRAVVEAAGAAFLFQCSQRSGPAHRQLARCIFRAFVECHNVHRTFLAQALHLSLKLCSRRRRAARAMDQIETAFLGEVCRNKRQSEKRGLVLLSPLLSLLLWKKGFQA